VGWEGWGGEGGIALGFRDSPRFSFFWLLGGNHLALSLFLHGRRWEGNVVLDVIDVLFILLFGIAVL